jgi:microcin C transport system permease protein
MSEVQLKSRTIEAARKPLFALSPMTQRRWTSFQANRRGYWSMWIFLSLFTITLFAELIANDKPLLVRFDSEYYFPVFKKYSEVEFGGIFKVEAEYRDPHVQHLIADKGGWMIWPLIRYNYQTVDLYLQTPTPSPPSARHVFGTDDGGRDILAKLIYGFRLSILFGLVLTFCSSIIGVTAGAIQGYFGGIVDLIAQRFIEIWAGLPILLILIILASIIESNVFWLLGILIAFGWMALVGVVRAEFLRARNFEYVRAARALGLGDVNIMYKHVLPNAMVATLTFVPFILNGSITALTSLDFLGFGLPPESASLGRLLRQGNANLQAPWLGLTAVGTISIMLILLIFVGEAVRDAFDPRKTTLGASATAL